MPTATGYTPEAITPGEGLRHVFRASASGVFVVTTVTENNTPAGFTASSVTSVSIDPAVVSFSLQAGSSSWPAIEHTRRVIIHSLGLRNADIAARFATSGIDRFADLNYTQGPHGLPLIPGTNGALVCSIQHVLPVGQSRMLIAEIDHALPAVTPDAPLVHTARAYWRPEKIADC